MSLKGINQVSIERAISETSQKHLKRDDFLSRLQDVSKTSQERCFSVAFLRYLKHISKNMSIT